MPTLRERYAPKPGIIRWWRDEFDVRPFSRRRVAVMPGGVYFQNRQSWDVETVEIMKIPKDDRWHLVALQHERISSEDWNWRVTYEVLKPPGRGLRFVKRMLKRWLRKIDVECMPLALVRVDDDDTLDIQDMREFAEYGA